MKKIIKLFAIILCLAGLAFLINFYGSKKPAKAAFSWPISQHFPSAKVGYYMFRTYPSVEGLNAYATWIAQHYDFIASTDHIDKLKTANPNIITTSYQWFHSYVEGFDTGDFVEPTKYTKIYNYTYLNNINPEDWFLHYGKNTITGYKALDYPNLPDDKFKYVYVDSTKKTDQAYGNANTFAIGQSVGSTLYVGNSFKFKEANLTFTSPGISWQGQWEYWNGSSWVALNITTDTTKNTSGFSMSQNGKVEFWQPPVDWKLGVVNSLAPSYWVRLRTTNIGTRYPTVETIKNQKFYSTVDYNGTTYLVFPGWDPSKDTNGDGVRDSAPDDITNTNGSSALFKAWSRPVTAMYGPNQSGGWGGYLSFTTNNNNIAFQHFVVDDDFSNLNIPPPGNTRTPDGLYYDGIDGRDVSIFFGYPVAGVDNTLILEFITDNSGKIVNGMTQIMQYARTVAEANNKLLGGNPTHHAINLTLERTQHFALREFLYGLWGVDRTSTELESSPYWQILNSQTYHRITAKEGIRGILNFNLGFNILNDGNISTLLTSDLTASSTTINVQDTSIFPNSGSLWTGTEKIRYTGKTTNSFSGLTRGADGTVAQAHTVSNAPYERIMPASSMDREKIYSLSLFYLIQNPPTDYFFLWKACCQQAYYTDFNAEARVFFVNAIQYDIGQPTGNLNGKPVLANTDWGVFVLATGTDFKVYGRDYSKAIVIAKPMTSAGYGDISKTTVNLPVTTDNPSGKYYILNEDNTINPTAITSMDLRSVEGAILIKESAIAGITLTKLVDKTSAKSGDTLTYTISYHVGTDAATNVKIEDNIPNGTTFISSANNGVFDSSKVTWTLGNLASGATGSVSFQVKIP